MKLEEVEQAQERIKNVIHNMPLTYSTLFSNMSGASIYLKCENLQKTGSFKIRGAFNKISKLSEEGNLNGVIAASEGNHAQGVAFASPKPGQIYAFSFKNINPKVKVIGVQSDGADAIASSFNSKKLYMYFLVEIWTLL